MCANKLNLLIGYFIPREMLDSLFCPTVNSSPSSFVIIPAFNLSQGRLSYRLNPEHWPRQLFNLRNWISTFYPLFAHLLSQRSHFIVYKRFERHSAYAHSHSQQIIETHNNNNINQLMLAFVIFWTNLLWILLWGCNPADSQNVFDRFLSKNAVCFGAGYYTKSNITIINSQLKKMEK